MVAWHEVAIDELFSDEGHQNPFTGTIFPEEGKRPRRRRNNGHQPLWERRRKRRAAYDETVFQKGLEGYVDWGHYIVIISVLLFRHFRPRFRGVTTEIDAPATFLVRLLYCPTSLSL